MIEFFARFFDMVKNSSVFTVEDRGWYALYNSKILNGGIRIRQNRIKKEKLEWVSDTSSYGQGWRKKSNDENEKSSWHHQSIENRPNFPFTRKDLCRVFLFSVLVRLNILFHQCFWTRNSPVTF